MVTRTSLFLVCLACASPALAGPMTPGERQRLVAHFEMTEGWLVSELDGLSDAQLTFKMTPASWSIQEVAEHLAIAEQWFLMISTHSQRHILQIREVKAHSGYPKR